MAISEFVLSVGAGISALFWTLQRHDLYNTMNPIDDHVQPGTVFEIAATVFCGVSILSAICGYVAAWKESVSIMYYFAIMSVVSVVMNIASFGYGLYIGIVAILGYETYDFILAIDLMPYVPTLILVEILVGLFIMTSIIGFRIYRDDQNDTKTNDQDYSTGDYTNYLANGTINKDYAESSLPDNIDLVKSMNQRGFDLRSFSTLDQEEEIRTFERSNINPRTSI